MTLRAPFLLVLVLLALAPSMLAVAADRSTPIPVGDVAPDIKLGDQHGLPFALSEILKERAFVVVAFYPKAFTGG